VNEVGVLPYPWSEYPDISGLDEQWLDLARRTGMRVGQAGTSVEGRPMRCLELGRTDGPVVLLTGLMHGVELVGAMALLDFVQRVATGPDSELRRHARLVVVPMVNPDAFAENCRLLQEGRRAYRRCNARGVDLNRNFPPLQKGVPLGLLGGSRWSRSPHYIGPHPLSEPETRALRDLAVETRPTVSVAFHSFGELVLYPWAFTDTPNPRRHRYERAGRAFLGALPEARYRFMQATEWYRTVGDMDDWLDCELGTLAFTVEVSRPMRRLSNLRRATNPFAWSNPIEMAPAVSPVAPGVDALVREALAA
jgi:predicted deacylase